MRYLATLGTDQLADMLCLARLKPALLAALVCGIMLACVLGLRLYSAMSVAHSI